MPASQQTRWSSYFDSFERYLIRVALEKRTSALMEWFSVNDDALNGLGCLEYSVVTHHHAFRYPCGCMFDGLVDGLVQSPPLFQALWYRETANGIPAQLYSVSVHARRRFNRTMALIRPTAMAITATTTTIRMILITYFFSF